MRADASALPKRDIYLVILDEYANAEVTAARYGFDNRVFLDSLRRLGFVVPVVHSNYLHTVLSIPSLLNASQLTDISGGRPSKDPTVPNYLVAHNRTVAFVRSQGYRVAFFPSFWWPSTRHNPYADVEVGRPRGFDIMYELNRTELWRTLRQESILDLLHRERIWQATDAEYLRRTFAGLARVPEIPGPVFAFAHVLSPHKPFTFARDCRPLSALPASPKRLNPYVDQVECLDRMVLSLVTTLQRKSDVPPVILLQGDHGTAETAFDSAAHRRGDPDRGRSRAGRCLRRLLPAGPRGVGLWRQRDGRECPGECAPVLPRCRPAEGAGRHVSLDLYHSVHLHAGDTGLADEDRLAGCPQLSHLAVELVRPQS